MDLEHDDTAVDESNADTGTMPVKQLVIGVAPSRIKPSPSNPRKHFDQVELEELAESFESLGVLQPLLVRPAKNLGKEVDYELVLGERRWRASKIAKLATVPVMVRAMNDKEVLEAQVVENAQREDVHPLEEADAYRVLIDKHGHTAESVAAKTGKTLATVYARLKLCDLKGEGARAAFLDGRINASVALLIARIPVPALQDQATKDILAGVEHEARGGALDKPARVTEPLGFRAAQLLLQEKYMLKLGAGLFPVADAGLVPSAGACTTCPHRTGNQRDLYEEVKSADVCTNPPCFKSKRDAQWAREAAKAKELGLGALTAKQCDEVFARHDHNPSHVWLKDRSKYASVDDGAPHEVTGNYGSTPWASLFGGKDKVPVIVARDPNGKVWELVDVAKAKATLQKAGKLKKKRGSGSADNGDRVAASNKAAETRAKNAAAAKKVEDAIAREVLGELADATVDLGALDKLRAIAGDSQLDFWGESEKWLMSRHKGISKSGFRSTLGKAAESKKSADALISLLLEAVIASAVTDLGVDGDRVKALAKALGLDHGKMVKAATEKHTPKPDDEKPAGLVKLKGGGVGPRAKKAKPRG